MVQTASDNCLLTGTPAVPATTGRELDQFYTKPTVAKQCWKYLLTAIGRLNAKQSDFWFVEPAAGCGCFYQILPPQRRIGIDIAPGFLPTVNGKGIAQADYLEWQPKTTKRSRRYAVIGNPPFGKRGKLAVGFFNHSDFAEIIAFVVPVTFRKHFIHRQLLPNYSLITRRSLKNNSFCTPDGKDYAINAEFQVWTRLPHSLRDKREKSPAPIQHPDFEMRQYNNTKQALPMFDAPFDFAVPCQGYQDYSRREIAPADCEKHKQWMLFIAKNAEVRGRLMKIDYATLAHNCATATPGFRKNDVVKHYNSPCVWTND